jgi:hypothetical protein
VDGVRCIAYKSESSRGIGLCLLKLDKEGGCEGNGGAGVREEWKNIRFVDQRGRGEERSKEERRGFNLISSTRILQSSASHGNN